MKHGRYRSLILLNGALIGVLALVTIAPHAGAQGGKRNRPKGQYTLVSGQVQGMTESAIFVLDSANEQLLGLKWDRSRKQLTGIGLRNLAEDAQLRGRQGGGGR